MAGGEGGVKYSELTQMKYLSFFQFQVFGWISQSLLAGVCFSPCLGNMSRSWRHTLAEIASVCWSWWTWCWHDHLPSLFYDSWLKAAWWVFFVSQRNFVLLRSNEIERFNTRPTFSSALPSAMCVTESPAPWLLCHSYFSITTCLHSLLFALYSFMWHVSKNIYCWKCNKTI